MRCLECQLLYPSWLVLSQLQAPTLQVPFLLGVWSPENYHSWLFCSEVLSYKTPVVFWCLLMHHKLSGPEHNVEVERGCLQWHVLGLSWLQEAAIDPISNCTSASSGPSPVHTWGSACQGAMAPERLGGEAQLRGR